VGFPSSGFGVVPIAKLGNCRNPIFMVARCSILIFSLWLTARAVSAADVNPSAEDVVRGLVERLKSMPELQEGRAHVCRRLTVFETLEADGQISERKTKEYRVAVTNGVETTRLVRIDDHEPPPADARSEERKDREARERYGKSSGVKKRRGMEVIDESLIRRFDYRWVGHEVIAGRTNHVLEFSARHAEPGRSSANAFADRLMSQLQGRLWIDTQEHELVRVEARLGKSFDVLAGVVASIQKMTLLIERFRLPDGRWVDGRFQTAFEGRKFLSALRMRLQVEQDRYETTTVNPG
jgi:hypothetical protein